MASVVMRTWVRFPSVCELVPIRDPYSVVRKIGTTIFGLAPMSRFPECKEDLNETSFVRAICIQFDDAGSHWNILIVVIHAGYHPPVPVGFVRVCRGPLCP